MEDSNKTQIIRENSKYGNMKYKLVIYLGIHSSHDWYKTLKEAKYAQSRFINRDINKYMESE